MMLPTGCVAAINTTVASGCCCCCWCTGIVGVGQVDTFGDIIPPRTLSAQRDGAFGWVQREGETGAYGRHGAVLHPQHLVTCAVAGHAVTPCHQQCCLETDHPFNCLRWL
jgi:hypothetical protein